MFDFSHKLIPREDRQMPICIDNMKKGDCNIYSAEDEVYHQEVTGKFSGKPRN